MAIPARRLETAIQFVISDPAASSAWSARALAVEPTPYAAPYVRFDERAYPILAPGRPGPGRGGTGVWLGAESVDAKYREPMAEGVRFNEEPYDIPPGRLVTLFDPDGNLIGFIDNTRGGTPGPR